jgi:hypothetical protein
VAAVLTLAFLVASGLQRARARRVIDAPIPPEAIERFATGDTSGIPESLLTREAGWPDTTRENGGEWW